METKELMQFDWVCLENDPTPRQLDFIRTGEVGLYWNKIVTPPYIKPIPLTPEILEKNGFIKESRENHGNILQYCILTDGLWIDISGENYFEGKLEYIHQLQHALRLCGVEKEIELCE